MRHYQYSANTTQGKLLKLPERERAEEGGDPCFVEAFIVQVLSNRILQTVLKIVLLYQFKYVRKNLN